MGGKASKSLLKKIEEKELIRIKILYEQLSAPTKGKGIDLETFKQMVGLPDYVAEQAFRVFENKSTHALISLDDFMYGMALCAHGTECDKLKAIFAVFDHDADRHINKQNVKAVLIPISKSEIWNSKKDNQPPPSEFVKSLMEMGFQREICEKAVVATKNEGLDATIHWLLTHRMNDPEKEVHTIIESMFDGAHDINWSKFKKWATGPKRSIRVNILVEAVGNIYTRTIQYMAPVKAVGPNDTALVDFPQQDSESKSDKSDKKSKRSIRMRLKRKTSTSDNMRIADSNTFGQNPLSMDISPALLPQQRNSANILDLSNVALSPIAPSGVHTMLDLTSSLPSSPMSPSKRPRGVAYPTPPFTEKMNTSTTTTITTPTSSTTVPFAEKLNATKTPITTAASTTTTTITSPFAESMGATSGATPPVTPSAINITNPFLDSSTSSQSVSSVTRTPTKDWWESDDEEDPSEDEDECEVVSKPPIIVIKDRSEVVDTAVTADLKQLASQLSIKTSNPRNSVSCRRGHQKNRMSSSLDSILRFGTTDNSKDNHHNNNTINSSNNNNAFPFQQTTSLPPTPATATATLVPTDVDNWFSPRFATRKLF